MAVQPAHGPAAAAGRLGQIDPAAWGGERRKDGARSPSSTGEHDTARADWSGGTRQPTCEAVEPGDPHRLQAGGQRGKLQACAESSPLPEAVGRSAEAEEKDQQQGT